MMEQVASIVAAFCRKNHVPTDELPALIKSVQAAFASLNGSQPAETVVPPIPAVPVRHSVFPEYLVCLEDGKKLKMLKRHLMNGYGLTPAAYRERWGLKPDYPMVAPAYSETRSMLAKSVGLGRRGSSSVVQEPSSPAPPTKQRGRPRKIAA